LALEEPFYVTFCKLYVFHPFVFNHIEAGQVLGMRNNGEGEFFGNNQEVFIKVDIVLSIQVTHLVEPKVL